MNYVNIAQVSQLKQQGFRTYIRHEELPDNRSRSHRTSCWIRRISDGKIMCQAAVDCSRQDQFSRHIGSSRAFTRAIRNWPGYREDRIKRLRVEV